MSSIRFASTSTCCADQNLSADKHARSELRKTYFWIRSGILTNGEVWRLYCRDSKASHYFALNFELALKSREDFKIVLALFSSAAFTRDAQGKCRLDQVHENALAAQSELEEDLRKRVFTLVENLANGFAERPENHIGDTSLSLRTKCERAPVLSLGTGIS